MAGTTWYGDGTATVAVGSRTVTGEDTGWLTEVAGMTPIKAGDKFGIHVGRPIVIETIVSDTELLLADDWPGPAQTDAPYKIELTSPTITAVEAMRRLLASLANGNLDSFADLTIGVDDIPIGIGPGVLGTVKKSELKDGLQFDEAVADIAGRAAYDTAAAEFRVLVADIGDGRSAVYIKESAASGDWSVPYYITGSKGDQGDPGPAGINPVGNYSSGSTYAERDAVLNNGSTWIAKSAVPTGQAPPTLPTTENTYWRLLAQKGTDGSGTGDVTGAASSVDGQFAAANGTTGKSIKFLTAAQARQALGGWEAIFKGALSGVVSWSQNDLSAFRMLKIKATIENASESGVLLRVSNDNGVTWAAGSTAYSYASSQRSSGPTSAWNAGTAEGASIQGGTFSFSIFDIDIHEFNFASRFTHLRAEGSRATTGGLFIFDTKSSFDTARAENAIQLINVNGVLMSGFLELEGLRG